MESDSKRETGGSETQVMASQWGSTEEAGADPVSCFAVTEERITTNPHPHSTRAVGSS